MMAAALAFFHSMPAAGNDQHGHGRELVAQFQLPGDAVARYAALAHASHESAAASERTALIDSTVWVGPLQQVGIGRNPYKMVLTVHGVARASSDVRARWQAGWEVRESATATREVLMSVGAQHEGSTQAGAPVTLTAVSAPLTFRGERQVSPLLNLVHANNLDISAVHLQIWSGSAPLLSWPAVSALRPALLGLGALCLLMWFFLRAGASPAAPTPVVVSPLPKAELRPLLEHEARADHPPTPTQAAAPQPNQALRVVSALRDVLTVGLSLPTQYDPTRRPRR
jgi:hypothetical protein